MDWWMINLKWILICYIVITCLCVFLPYIIFDKMYWIMIYLSSGYYLVVSCNMVSSFIVIMGYVMGHSSMNMHPIMSLGSERTMSFPMQPHYMLHTFVV